MCTSDAGVAPRCRAPGGCRTSGVPMEGTWRIHLPARGLQLHVPIARLDEHRAPDPEGAGSSPVGNTFFDRCLGFLDLADQPSMVCVAQSVERRLVAPKAGGSRPLVHPFTGRWCSRLTYRPVTSEITGSNPVRPAILVHGPVAQRPEQTALNREVVGSSPTGSTTSTTRGSYGSPTKTDDPSWGRPIEAIGSAF